MQNKNNKTVMVSVIKNFTENVRNISTNEVHELIKSNEYAPLIAQVRKVYAEQGKEAADELKKGLIAFTPSGIFNNGRKAANITEYNNHVILDIDGLTENNVNDYKQLAIYCQYSHLVFISPSGKGLKIIVRVSSPLEHHKLAFNQLSKYYEQALDVDVDPSGKDVSRLCFISHDHECFINENADIFPVEVSDNTQKERTYEKKPKANYQEILNNNDESENWQAIYEDCVLFTNKIKTYQEGNRNNYIHLLACNCNRKGIPFQNAITFISTNYDLSQPEIDKAVESAYKNSAEFANFASSQNPEHEDESKSDWSQSPKIPEKVFKQLPDILHLGCNVFSDPRERDVFLTGALSILSGCLNFVKGQYRGDEVYPHLYSFTIAPAASGKGALNYAKRLGDTIHQRLLTESKAAQKRYKQEEVLYKKTLFSKKQEGPIGEEPDEPPFKILFIPANNSSAKVISHLKDSEGHGIFCATEADTMGNTLKQDWGGYSDLLRMAFHHEPISYSRKGNNEWVEVESPRLAVALAGTPSQVSNLISSAEDGLFSRFIFYAFRSQIKWKKAHAQNNGTNFTQHFKQLSLQVNSMHLFYETFRNYEFIMSDDKWEKLNEFGENCLLSDATFISEELASTAKRFGLILFRIAMVLTALRYFDNAEASVELECSDEDFETALDIANTYHSHALLMFDTLPKDTKTVDEGLKKFFDLLPESFKRKDVITTITKDLNLSERTFDYNLKKLTETSMLAKEKAGVYTKKK